MQSGEEVVECGTLSGGKPTSGVANHNGFSVAVHAQQASCQGEDGARPAASAGQDIHLRARDTGGEAEEAFKVVLDKPRRQREGEDEAASHDLVPLTLSQIYIILHRIFNL